MKPNGKTLGILGGMGPAATAEFMRLLAVNAPADKDQEHARMFVYSNPITPDRTSFILGQGPDPSKYLRDGLDTLTSWGADMLAVTCNTAHFFIDQFRNELKVPVVHIVEETIAEAASLSPRGAWLVATFGTINTGLYQKHAEKSAYSFRIPSNEMQVRIQEVIEITKAGKLDEAGSQFKKICEELWAIEDLPIIGACTEIPIAYQYSGLPLEKSVSSLSALANGCLKRLY